MPPVDRSTWSDFSEAAKAKLEEAKALFDEHVNICDVPPFEWEVVMGIEGKAKRRKAVLDNKPGERIRTIVTTPIPFSSHRPSTAPAYVLRTPVRRLSRNNTPSFSPLVLLPQPWSR